MTNTTMSRVLRNSLRGRGRPVHYRLGQSTCSLPAVSQDATSNILGQLLHDVLCSPIFDVCERSQEIPWIYE